MTARKPGVTVAVQDLQDCPGVEDYLVRLERGLSRGGRSVEVRRVVSAPDASARVATLAPAESGWQTTASLSEVLESATFEHFVHLDTYYPPEQVAALLDVIDSGAPMVLGVTTPHTSAPARARASRSIAKLLLRPLTRISDPLGTAFAVRRSAVDLTGLAPDLAHPALTLVVRRLEATPTECMLREEAGAPPPSQLGLAAFLFELERHYSWRWPLFTQLAEFCTVGFLGMAVDFTVVTILVELFGMYFGWAQFPAFVVALTFNFVLNDLVTFATQAPRSLSVWARYATYALTCSAGGLVRFLVSVQLYESAEFFERYYLLAAFIGVVAGTVVNFAGARWITFRADSEPEAAK